MFVNQNSMHAVHNINKYFDSFMYFLQFMIKSYHFFYKEWSDFDKT
jgi:hypothetical protein